MNKIRAFAAFFQRNFVTVSIATFFIGSLSAGLIRKTHSFKHKQGAHVYTLSSSSKLEKQRNRVS
jgi:hypothetical protein